jgi:hypothetical protein
MMNNIGWQSYWLTIALLCAGYYLVIYIIYFRNDFVLRSAKAGLKKSENSLAAELSPEEHLFNTCLNELTAFFEEAKQTEWNKDDLTNSLKKLFNKYSSLNTTEYYGLLTHIVVGQCESNCSIRLSSEEVQGVVGKVNG